LYRRLTERCGPFVAFSVLDLGENWRESQDDRVRDTDTRLAGGGGGAGGERSDGQLREWLVACWGVVEELGHLSSKEGFR
jgi:hypothetical protein